MKNDVVDDFDGLNEDNKQANKQKEMKFNMFVCVGVFEWNENSLQQIFNQSLNILVTFFLSSLVVVVL